MSKPHAHFQTINKTSARISKTDETVRGDVLTKHSLVGSEMPKNGLGLKVEKKTFDDNAHLQTMSKMAPLKHKPYCLLNYHQFNPFHSG